LLKISSAKEQFERKTNKNSMNVQKEERVEDSLELLMEGEEGEVVEDSFDNIFN